MPSNRLLLGRYLDLEQPTVLEGEEARQPAGRRAGFVSGLDPDFVQVDENIAGSRRDDHGVRYRPPAVRRRILGVESGRHPAQVVGEAAVRRVEVEVAHLVVASVPEPVHDERWRERERAGGEDALLPIGPDQERQLAREDVEEVAVGAMDVRRGAVAPGPTVRPGRDQRRVVEQDLGPAARPVDDDLAVAGT